MGTTPSSPGLKEMVQREDGFVGVNHDLMLVGGGINEYDNNGFTPLHKAILKGSLTAVKRLIELGADPKVKTKSGFSAFHIATKTGNMEIMAVLLSKHVDVDEVSKQKEEHKLPDDDKIVFVGGSTALHVAAQLGHTKVAHLLASLGQAAEKVKNDDGLTPEEVAKTNHHSEVVQVLKNDLTALRKDFERHRQEVDERFRQLEKRLRAVEGKQNAERNNSQRNLTEAEKGMIRSNFVNLSRKMNVKQMICLLYARCVLTCEDMESLRSLQESDELQKKFIINKKLVEGKVKDIKMVKDVFKDSGHESLVKCLPNV